MPALAFGLKPTQKPTGPPKVPAKRKAAFGQPEDDSQDEAEDDNDGFSALAKSKSKPPPKPANQSEQRAHKSPKLDTSSNGSSLKYSNLSALRSAKLHDAEASQLDASVYDYDAVYETFNASKDQKKAANGDGGVPKYMSNLLASAEVRKRDQLRAKEKQLQKERDAEGDEFADKEKFVTEAYKKQQEENRQLEEEEKRKEAEEEERRRKGGGMTGFHKDLLKKDEERQRDLERAAELVQKKKEVGETAEQIQDEEDKPDVKVAAELNEQGAHIVTNDEGEIVDKRQLLTAGLNVAPKKPDTGKFDKKAASNQPQEWQRSAKQQDARLSQRERQSRMMERQIEEIEAKQKEAELAEKKELEDKNKSKLTESDKLSAKERYLQRKKEREEEAERAKTGAG